jgi:hypothetical protein
LKNSLRKRPKKQSNRTQSQPARADPQSGLRYCRFSANLPSGNKTLSPDGGARVGFGPVVRFPHFW